MYYKGGMMLLELALAIGLPAAVLALVIWAHAYKHRERTAPPTEEIRHPICDISAYLPEKLSRDLLDELNAETERWIWKAMARGVGNRVWRSDPMWEGQTMKHAFAILEPDDPAPGAGMIFGPFSG